MTKVMAPAQMKMKAGSNAMLVSLLRLLNVSFSDQAQIPIASTPSPSSCSPKHCIIQLMWSPLTQKMTLKPKMTYLRQQETSLVSRILLLRLWFAGWEPGIAPSLLSHSQHHTSPICDTLSQLRLLAQRLVGWFARSITWLPGDSTVGVIIESLSFFPKSKMSNLIYIVCLFVGGSITICSALGTKSLLAAAVLNAVEP